MSETFATHPTPDQLASFANGQVDDIEAEWIERHLADCLACRSAADATPDDPVVRMLRRADPTATASRILPGFESLDEIGRGGMAVVYKARQIGLNRFVALKRILAGSDAGPEDLSRFQREAEAVARLHHPNIVQIFEVGEQDGQPYLALELVTGGTLQQFAGGRPQPPRLAADLVETLARAIHHAHEHGIVHRDLKPSNVLLLPVSSGPAADTANPVAVGTTVQTDAFPMKPAPVEDPRRAVPVPKIADFGLAKFLDRSVHQTRTGAILGTPSYMAPEQAAGRPEAVGHGADLYSLGAILYELLTGRPPFQAATSVEALRLAATEDPVPPRRMIPTLPRDLETICLKCLQKSPARRYGTAADLADDLARFRRGEAIRARPTGPLERLVRWARRRPAAAAAIGLGLLAGSGGVAGVAWHNVELRRERDQTAAERRRAEANLRAAMEAVNRMLVDVADHRLAGVPEMEEARQRILEEAVTMLRSLVREQGEADPTLRLWTAHAHFRCGHILKLLYRTDEAVAHLQQADAILAEIPASSEVFTEARERAIFVQTDLGEIRSKLDREAAMAAYRRGLGIAEALWAEEPANIDRRYAVFICRRGIDGLQLNTLPPAESRANRRATLAHGEAVVARSPANRAYVHDLATAYHNEAVADLAERRLAEAEKWLRLGLALFEPLSPEDRAWLPLQALAAHLHNALGELYRDTQRPKEAEAEHRQAIAVRRSLAQRFPKFIENRLALAQSHHNLGVLLQFTTRKGEAETAFRDAIAGYEQLINDFPDDPNFSVDRADSQTMLGLLQSQLGKRDAATDLLRRAHAAHAAAAKARPGSVFHADRLAMTCTNIGMVETTSGRLESARDWYGQAVAALASFPLQELPANGPRLNLATAHGGRANALAAMDKHREAIADWDRLIDLLPEPVPAEYRLLRAISLAKGGRPDRAMAEVEALARRDGLAAAEAYNLACIASLCAAEAGKDAWAVRGLDLLKTARRLGYFKDATRVVAMHRDADLTAVRKRADFPAWAAELGK